MKDTPETDLRVIQHQEDMEGGDLIEVVPADFARAMERRLRDVLAQRATLMGSLESLITGVSVFRKTITDIHSQGSS